MGARLVARSGRHAGSENLNSPAFRAPGRLFAHKYAGDQAKWIARRILVALCLCCHAPGSPALKPRSSLIALFGILLLATLSPSAFADKIQDYRRESAFEPAGKRLEVCAPRGIVIAV